MLTMVPAKAYQLILLCGLFIIASVLIFANLSSQYLWQDEAETALLGLNIVHYGLPKAFDGTMLISQEWGDEFEDDYLWRWTPWLDKYLAAGSFFIFGKSTFAARFPFAFLGVVNIFLTFFVCRSIFRNTDLGIMSAFWLVFSVPFLLFTRQCRYYSVMIFATLLTVYFFYGLLRKQKYALPGFVIGATILFHANYFAFFCTVACLLAGVFIFYFDLKKLVAVIAACAAAAAVNFPWMLFFKIFQKSRGMERLVPVKGNFLYYISAVYHSIFSFLVLGLFIIAWFLEKKRYASWSRENKREFLFISFFCLSYMSLISFLPWHFYRYMVNLIPFFTMMVVSMVLAMIRSRSKWTITALALVALVHICHPAQLWPQKHAYLKTGQKNLFVDYLYEITHDYAGPLEKTARYLNRNAKKDDTIFVSYGDLVMRFYTGLDVFGGQSGVDLAGRKQPDWLFPRRFFTFIDRPAAKLAFEKNLALFKKWVSTASYKRIELSDAPDIYWENRPDPAYHLFASPDSSLGFSPVEILKKQ